MTTSPRPEASVPSIDISRPHTLLTAKPKINQLPLLQRGDTVTVKYITTEQETASLAEIK